MTAPARDSTERNSSARPPAMKPPAIRCCPAGYSVRQLPQVYTSLHRNRCTAMLPSTGSTDTAVSRTATGLPRAMTMTMQSASAARGSRYAPQPTRPSVSRCSHATRTPSRTNAARVNRMVRKKQDRTQSSRRCGFFAFCFAALRTGACVRADAFFRAGADLADALPVFVREADFAAVLFAAVFVCFGNFGLASVWYMLVERPDKLTAFRSGTGQVPRSPRRRSRPRRGDSFRRATAAAPA